ncbi:cytochrome b/b6 domain-containing protein [Rubrimonas cliftonensis]|uniref:Cytochrome b n=1 Tax=Rubrimonas cliftonensis TaxID=89524 RepID=A0A1H4C4Y7_9RHOB|nr:cytochrome b/b6 domain-containing protein [Rubrimonas cliftonensis]SEA55451.1 Cytochrome b [Rubrimonas cliftonensis]
MAEPVERARVWDPALRVFHWALAAAVVTGWVLGEFGPAIMTWHFWCGYAVGALVLFRLVWGFVGPETARFAHFLRGPRPVLAYLREMPERRPSRWRGHAPLGGWATVALLALLAAQVATGLFADPDDYINVGPLAHLIPAGDRLTAAALHALIAKALLAMVLLHLAAVAFYAFWKREDLVRPMIDGRKLVRRRD